MAYRSRSNAGLRTAAKKNKLIPFEKMHPSMAKLPTQEQSSLAFAEVFTFIEYLIEKKGWAGIRRVLLEMKKGATDEQAIATVYGAPLKRLAKRWMKTLKTRKIKTGSASQEQRLVIKDSGDVPDDKLHGLSKQGRRFARAADLLYARGRVTAAQKELQKAYDATKSPLISAKLALLALHNGDMKAAEKAALNAMAGTPDLAGPNITLAEVLFRTGRGDKAWTPLARAIDINPFDPRIHSLTLSLLGDDGDPKRKAQASRALALIGAPRSAPPVRLGQGGLIQIEGPPFRRVFLRPEDGRRNPNARPTHRFCYADAAVRRQTGTLPPRAGPTERPHDRSIDPNSAHRERWIAPTGDPALGRQLKQRRPHERFHRINRHAGPRRPAHPSR